MKMEIDFSDEVIRLSKDTLKKGYNVLLKIEGKDETGEKLRVSVIRLDRKLLNPSQSCRDEVKTDCAAETIVNNTVGRNCQRVHTRPIKKTA